MTPPEIEGMLKEMVAPLNDDHVEIELTESYSPLWDLPNGGSQERLGIM
jgi:hypothetical protein